MTPSILVVDDDAATAKLYSRIISAEGCRCTTAGDVGAARRRIEAGTYDLILCDVMLPDGNGIDLIADLMVEGCDHAVIMVTGVDDPDICRRAVELGVYAYLIKPVPKSQLRISVQNALHRLTLERNNRRYQSELEATVDELHKTVEALKAANATIQQQQEAVVAKERLEVLLQVAGATAHELNQPLQVLLGHIELMETDGGDAPRQTHCAHQIKQAGRRMAAIVAQIRRIHQDKLKPYDGSIRIIDIDQ